MFAVLHFPQFALQAALRHSPELWAEPVALVDPALSTPRVCDQTFPALEHGVEIGLTPTQALARCRDVSIRHRSLAQEAAATGAILQCAYGFSPHIEHTAPGTITLDLRGLSELSARPAAARHRKPFNADTATGPADGAPPSSTKTSETQSEPTSTPAPSAKATGASREAEPMTPGPALESWAARLHQALASLNLAARIGIGPTPNVARHAATWGRPNPENESARPKDESTRPKDESARADRPTGPSSSVQIVADAPGFIASLPVDALNPSTDVSGILEKWGVRTVGELLALGQDAVMDRLGLEAIALFAAASAHTARPLNLVRPSDTYEESFDFEQPVETIEPLLFILNRFVVQISQRLELGALAAEQLALRLRLDSGEVLECRLRVPQPTRRADILFRMLQTHLDAVRTGSPIVAVALQADPTRPGQKQFSLFEAALQDPHQFQETLARLSALVGAGRVGTPVRENSHRPDTFKLVPPDFENAPTPPRRRAATILRQTPLRRLRPAAPATVELAESQRREDSRSVEPPSPGIQGKRAAHSTNIVDLLGPLFRRPPDGPPRPPRPPESSSTVRGGTDLGGERTGSRDDSDGTVACAAPDSPAPLSLRCCVTQGKLAVALGPWRASGHWWEAGAWQRDEWDVQTRQGQAVRLVQAGREWHVEAILD